MALITALQKKYGTTISWSDLNKKISTLILKAKSYIVYQCYSLVINSQDKLISNYVLVFSKSKILVCDVSLASSLAILNIEILSATLLSPFIFPLKLMSLIVPYSLQVFSLSGICTTGVFFWDKKSVEISTIAMR